jgi:hypothetical protein
LKPGCRPFAQGLWALADAHGCELIGGDTTQGPLNICITVFGEVPAGRRPCCAAARSRATTSMSAARWGTPGWRWRHCTGASRCNCPKRCWRLRTPAPGAAHTPRRPGAGPARRGQRSAPTSATACSATWATSCSARAWGPPWTPKDATHFNSCLRICWRAAKAVLSTLCFSATAHTSACWPVATITSWCFTAAPARRAAVQAASARQRHAGYAHWPD